MIDLRAEFRRSMERQGREIPAKPYHHVSQRVRGRTCAAEGCNAVLPADAKGGQKHCGPCSYSERLVKQAAQHAAKLERERGRDRKAKPSTGARVCKACGEDISLRPPVAIRCIPCGREAQKIADQGRLREARLTPERRAAQAEANRRYKARKRAAA